MHFLPIHTHGRGRADAQANPIAFSGGHDDPDLPINDDLFTDTPTEHQHGFPSMIPEPASLPVGLHAHCIINARLGPKMAQSGRTAMFCG